MSTPKFIFLQQPSTCPAPGNEWEMWSALATMAATLVALGLPLFLHFHAERRRRNEHAETVAQRTADVSPQLAGDVMRVQWGLLSVMRTLQRASHEAGDSRFRVLATSFKLSHLHVTLLPGTDVFPGDVELLNDDVRSRLSAFKAQVTVMNAMVVKVMQGPVEPYKNREALVNAQLVHLAGQVVGTNETGLELMNALRPFLPPDLKPLEESLKGNKEGFTKIYADMLAVHQRENPPKPAA